jgi:hypothetical protein
LSVPRENEKKGKRKKRKKKRKSFLMHARELKGALHKKARNYVSYSADRKLKERDNRKPQI